MQTARLKRKENIAEYILYIWQLEDLLRAMQFSPEAVYSQLVGKQQADGVEKQAAFLWYMDIANLLKSEGKEEVGHIDHTMHLIKDLNELHGSLLLLPSGEKYRQVFAPLAEVLPLLKERMEKPDMSDVEFAMRALYSVMLYRIKGDVGHLQYQKDVLAVISPVIALLAKIYKDIEAGEFNLYGE